MTYKNKDHMEWLLQKTDYYTENAVTEERIHEIREVYAKAKAFDEVVNEMEMQAVYEISDGDTLKNIDRIIHNSVVEDSGRNA